MDADERGSHDAAAQEGLQYRASWRLQAHVSTGFCFPGAVFSGYSIRMQSSSGDASLLRRLALAFGEGLVFSVGMKLTEDAIRPRDAAIAAGAGPELAPLAERLARIEKRLKEVDGERASAAPSQMDQKVIRVIVGAVEKHLEAHAIKVQQRIDELQASISAGADAATIERIGKETAAVRQQVQAMQRDVLGAVAQLIAREVATQVAQRTAALEAKIQASVGSAVESAVQSSVDAAVAPLRAEVRDLRGRLSETDDTMAEFVSAISDTVRRTSETLPASARAEGEWRPGGKLDLKTLRKRLSQVDRNPVEPRFGMLPIPAAAQKRGPAPVRRFPVAS